MPDSIGPIPYVGGTDPLLPDPNAVTIETNFYDPSSLDFLAIQEYKQNILEAIRQLRQALELGNYEDWGIRRDLYSAMQEFTTESRALTELIKEWDALLSPRIPEEAQEAHQLLGTQVAAFNAAITSLRNADIAARNALINALNAYKFNVIPIPDQATERQRALDAVTAWNNYLSNRSSIDDEHATLEGQFSTYNNLISSINDDITSVNEQRALFGLDPIPLYSLEADPRNDYYDPSLSNYTNTIPAYEDRGDTAVPTISIPASNFEPLLDILAGIDVALFFDEIGLAVRTTWEAIWGIQSFADVSYEIEKEALENQLYYRLNDLVDPSAIFDQTMPDRMSSVTEDGGSSPASSADSGSLYSPNIEREVGDGLFRAAALENGIPIGGGALDRYKFGVEQVIFESQVNSAAYFGGVAGGRMGGYGNTSRADQIAQALGFSGAVVNRIGSNENKAVANSEFNRTVFESREEIRAAEAGLADAEGLFTNAASAGDVNAARAAIRKLIQALRKLLSAVTLGQQINTLSEGEKAAFTDQTTSVMNFALTRAALAGIGNSIGVPNLDAQIIANFTSIPSSKLLKKVQGNNDEIRQIMIEELKKQGFSLFQANMLANEIIGRMKEDLQAAQVDISFGLNIDQSIVAQSVVQDLKNQNMGLYNAMLENTLKRAQMMGRAYDSEKVLEFLSQADDRDQLLEQALNSAITRALKSGNLTNADQLRYAIEKELRDVGFSRSSAQFLAHSSVNFIVRDAAFPPMGVSEDRISYLQEFLAEMGGNKGAAIQAIARAKEGAPYTSEEGFIDAASQAYGSIVGDPAQAQQISLALQFDLMSQNDLVSIVGNKIEAAFREVYTESEAADLRDHAMMIIFGGRDLEEIKQNEEKDSLSLLNTTRDELKKLYNKQDEELSDEMNRQLIRTLQALLVPNSESGFAQISIGDSPSNFINNLAMAGQRKRSIDIPI